MRDKHKIFSTALLSFSVIMAISFFFFPAGYLNSLNYISFKILAVVNIIVFSFLLAFVIRWFFYEPKPTRLLAGTCRLLTTAFFASLASILSFLPNIDRLSFNKDNFIIEFSEHSSELTTVFISTMIVLVFTSTTYAFVYYYDQQTIDSKK
ncbi:hypothetical protein J7481_12935 [Labrenzia sp. R4_2]|uniref:hypothetical protein n=1 Tax=Labrenzia sp. R4_2 TaxID=2821107 RepID=UPI001ADB02B4|nr:hypothetical protein [Labrenzia sp. R4_2]MBO9420400.1 hypothetical protein [Labrenzia sp. R4_2]